MADAITIAIVVVLVLLIVAGVGVAVYIKYFKKPDEDDSITTTPAAEIPYSTTPAAEITFSTTPAVTISSSTTPAATISSSTTPAVTISSSMTTPAPTQTPREILETEPPLPTEIIHQALWPDPLPTFPQYETCGQGCPVNIQKQIFMYKDNIPYVIYCTRVSVTQKGLITRPDSSSFFCQLHVNAITQNDTNYANVEECLRHIQSIIYEYKQLSDRRYTNSFVMVFTIEDPIVGYSVWDVDPVNRILITRHQATFTKSGTTLMDCPNLSIGSGSKMMSLVYWRRLSS